MPRTARASVGGVCYHVINRGNNRAEVFFKEEDYVAFFRAIGHACVEVPMPVFAYCVMPNHFHLVVRPEGDGDLSTWMHWLLNAHVRRYHQHYRGSGHVWQGRFKAFPIQEDDHLVTVLRYVERNAVRAKLVRRAENWRWSSARLLKDAAARPTWLTDPPIVRGDTWIERVNASLTAAELDAVRKSVIRGTPFGAAPWQAATATRLGLESTLNPRGRPRKTPEGE